MPAILPNSSPSWRTRSATALLAALCLATPAAAAPEFGACAAFTGAPTEPVHAKNLDGAPLVVGARPDRVTLVHFFASWCEPCEEELPALAAFAAAERDRIHVIGVDVGEPASRARKFVQRFDLPGEVAFDQDKAIAAAFKVRGLPATVALSRDGARALGVAGPVDWADPKTLEA